MFCSNASTADRRISLLPTDRSCCSPCWYASMADDVLRESRSPAPKEQPPRESLRHTDRKNEATLESRARPHRRGKPQTR
jgi:hypothetical protein